MGPAAIKRQTRTQDSEVTNEGLLNDGLALRVTKGTRRRKGRSREKVSVEKERYLHACKAHLNSEFRDIQIDIQIYTRQ